MANNGGFIKRRRFLVPVLFVLVAGALAFGYWNTHLRGWVSTDDAVIESDPISISSKVAGRIVGLSCAQGDSVKPGQTLVRLDDADLRAQERQGEAALDLARQSVALAAVNVQKAQEDFNRSATQFQDAIVTREQYDHARRALDLAQAQARVSQATVVNSEAQLEVVRTQLRNMVITAPAAGVVARKWVVPGDIVQPGQPIYTVFDLSDVWITANFEETKLSSIHPGAPVEVTVDAYRHRKFSGQVSLLGAAASSQFSLIPPNNAAGNFTKVTQRVPVKIHLNESASERLLPGMSVEVKIRIQGR